MTCSIHRALREPCPTGCSFLERDREVERLVAAGLCPYKGCIEPALIGDMCVLHGEHVPAQREPLPGQTALSFVEEKP